MIARPMTPHEGGDALAPTVIVIDDDAELRDALANLFGSVGLAVVTLGSAVELLSIELPEGPTCLVLDIRLPSVSGLDFQNQLAQDGIILPIVFMTGFGDIPMTVRAMKAGAIDFLTKPFRDQEMLDAVSNALTLDRAQKIERRTVDSLRQRYKRLTPREKEVMGFAIQGLLNKQIASEMSLAEITVKIHRSNLMRKLGMRSVTELVRMADNLKAS